MNKILVFLSTIFFLFGFALAQEDINSLQMPSDEQIREIVSKYNVDPSQQELIFQETKKQLEILYNTNQIQEMYKAMDSSALEEIGGTLQEYQLPAENAETDLPNQTKEKKYAKHDPIFTKRSYGPKR